MFKKNKNNQEKTPNNKMSVPVCIFIIGSAQEFPCPHVPTSLPTLVGIRGG
jgi:hypothetical protein